MTEYLVDSTAQVACRQAERDAAAECDADRDPATTSEMRVPQITRLS